MKLIKCPKCELNYLKPGEEYCEVCLKDMRKRKAAEEPDTYICPECGESMVIKGQELCMACLIEKRKLEKAEQLDSSTPTDDDNILEIESIVNSSDMPEDEIVEEPVDTDEELDEQDLVLELDEVEAF